MGMIQHVRKAKKKYTTVCGMCLNEVRYSFVKNTHSLLLHNLETAVREDTDIDE